MIDAAIKILGKYREKKKNWITNELMDMCDLRKTIKQTKFEPGNKYKQINTQIKRELRKAKENWINHKCTDIGN